MSTHKKSNPVTTIILLAIFFALVMALGIGALLSNKVKMNPPGTIGNTGGNLNNSGLVCEYNNTVYFSNLNDGGRLYAMNPDESDLRMLNNMRACNILAGGDYMYFFQLKTSSDSSFSSITNSHSFIRCNLNGQKPIGLTRDVVVCGQLVDNYLYLLTAGKEHPVFYKLKIDKSDQVHLADYNINPACADNGIIYYNGTQEDHALYRLNTASDMSDMVWKGNLWYPVLNDDYIYYMDVSSNYRLCRYSLSQQVVEVLTNDRVDCFNVGSGYIYYQKSDATQPQLKCMHLDGSNAIVVADGLFENINMTSQYVYFQEFNVDSQLYHSRLGSDRYEAFTGSGK